MAGSVSGAPSTASLRHAISYVALALGVFVVVVTAGVSFGYMGDVFGGDFLNVGLFGLLMGGCAFVAMWTGASRADRVRAFTGLALCCVPVVMLAYFLAFTVE